MKGEDDYGCSVKPVLQCGDIRRINKFGVILRYNKYK